MNSTSPRSGPSLACRKRWWRRPKLITMHLHVRHRATAPSVHETGATPVDAQDAKPGSHQRMAFRAAPPSTCDSRSPTRLGSLPRRAQARKQLRGQRDNDHEAFDQAACDGHPRLFGSGSAGTAQRQWQPTCSATHWLVVIRGRRDRTVLPRRQESDSPLRHANFRSQDYRWLGRSFADIHGKHEASESSKRLHLATEHQA
jgi:hypothetical protein